MTQIPRAEAGLICPLHQRPVEEVCHACPWWIAVRGRNPNTGADVDQWGCAIGFLPMLLIENAAQARGAAAATENARNQIVGALADVSQAVEARIGMGDDAKLIGR